jgi:hypothetical protein
MLSSFERRDSKLNINGSGGSRAQKPPDRTYKLHNEPLAIPYKLKKKAAYSEGKVATF